MNSAVTLSIEDPRTATARMRVGLTSLPYLADHGFQGMVVLPGTFFVDAALGIEREVTGRTPGLVRDASFHNPIILSDDDTTVDIEMRDVEDGCVEYTFYEAAANAAGHARMERHPAARLVVDRSFPLAPEHSSSASGMEGFDAFDAGGAAKLYATLHANGNQYGPGFRRITSIRRAGDRVFANLSPARSVMANEFQAIHPAVLDAMTQMLAPFVVDKGRAFVLRKIERLDLHRTDFPETLRCVASLRAADAHAVAGDVTAFDDSGERYLDFGGVSYALLEPVETAGEVPLARCTIAANFTAEPLEDALAFWNDRFDGRIRWAFAPYDQVFQQLLDPQSAFGRNDDGVNVLLLRLEEWAKAAGASALPAVDRQRVDRALGTHARAVLPNGLEIAHLNRYETDYLYKEIFEDQCYLRHGIRLRDGDTVLDIGANIGLFSLFVLTRCRDPKIYAFEPAPLVHALLKANCEAYGGGRVAAFNAGVSDARKTATFTFYEKSSVFSGFHSDEGSDRSAIRAVVRNMLESIAGDSVDDYVDELVSDRLRQQTHECPLTTVSDIIRDHGIERVNLLKIDAEKSELDIIDGIADGDWPKIDQVVVEIHDPTREALRRVEALLTAKGYACAVEQESLLDRSGLFNLYATRRGAADAFAAGECTVGRAPGSDALARSAGEFGAALRSFAGRTTRPLILGFCPRTPRAGDDPMLAAALDELEAQLTAEAAGMANVCTVGSASMRERYALRDCYDPHGDAAAHMPYAKAGYAAIATAVVRALHGLSRSPFKAIVLDCDNTLWKGIVGEDGVHGIELSPHHLALQRFMVDRMSAGMLLCLCTRNNERDVMEVFERRREMVLTREHLVATRINWESKSRNIASLAQELGLGLDSFIFVDDSPFECAEVRTQCPRVLTLQLPSDDRAIGPFLDHVWAFDTQRSTDEDGNRTRMYRETAQRERFREQAFSLEDYIEGLNLQVDVGDIADEQLARASQLTFRTNQFNFTTRRRSEPEIRQFLGRPQARCLVVRVTDRFGDYGIVGVVMYETEAGRCRVDTLLLSCRVLGRGVEHAVLAALARRAIAEGQAIVDVECVPSERNAPALAFVVQIGERYRSGETSWSFPAEYLAGLRYEPDQAAATAAPSTHPPEPAPPRRAALAFDFADNAKRLQGVADTLRDAGALADRIDEFRMSQRSSQMPSDEPTSSTLEAKVRGIWRKVLGVPGIGLDDNFFEAGGTSLRAVQVLAMIKQDLKQTLSIVSLFECPTIRLLAARMGAGMRDQPGDAAIAAATQRGQKRRYHVSRQRAS